MEQEMKEDAKIRWVDIFEMKTSLGAPHTFYSRSLN
jgi:hypothetical protein